MAEQDAKNVTPNPLELMKLVQQQRVQSALQNPNLPHVYANGFALAFTGTDLSMILNVSGQPQAIIDMPWGIAKQIADGLHEVVGAYEKATGVPVKTPTELKGAMAEMTQFAKKKFGEKNV